MSLSEHGSATRAPLEHTTLDYDILPRRQAAIRILQLLPSSSPDADIQCRLAIPSGCEMPLYEALSWCWGTAGKTDYIGIFCGHSLKRKSVSPNLVAAMKALRCLDQNRFLWIDMVCIDQDKYVTLLNGKAAC